METFFSNATVQFDAVDLPTPLTSNVVPDINTVHFLGSCDKVVEFIGLFGAAFHPVKMDVGGNVTKVRLGYEKQPSACSTLDDLLLYNGTPDCSKGSQPGLTHVNEGFLWLTRGLNFMKEFLKSLIAESTDMLDDPTRNSTTHHVQKAYDTALKPHHGWISKQLFKVLVVAAPSRSSLLNAVMLNQNISDRRHAEVVALDDIRRFMENFEPTVAACLLLCKRHNLEKDVNI